MSKETAPAVSTEAEGQGLRRSLETRHMTMIAMGGAIGTACSWPPVIRSPPLGLVAH